MCACRGSIRLIYFPLRRSESHNQRLKHDNDELLEGTEYVGKQLQRYEKENKALGQEVSLAMHRGVE